MGGGLITAILQLQDYALEIKTAFIECLGVHDRTVSDQVQSISVSEIHINKRAMTKGYGNDIALIKLSRPALLSARVGLACLPSGRKTDRVTPGTMCYLTGKCRVNCF